MRFLLTRRWLIFFAVVIVVAWGCWRLGEWQFHRLADRETRNADIRHNLAAEPRPVSEVLSAEAPLPRSSEWSQVTAHGTYDDAATIVLRYQTRDGAAGVDLVTPLRFDDGSAVLVDRGWLATPNTGAVPTDLPAPPPGTVEVTGWARADATGDSTVVDQRSARALSSLAVAGTVSYPLYAGFVEAGSETPAPSTALVPIELPDLGNGPHLFYGIQWWFFGVLAVFGFGYLAYDERRRLPGRQ